MHAVRDVVWVRGDPTGHRLTRGAVYGFLVVIVLIKGLNWPIMAVGLQTLTPIWMGAFRVIGAAVLVFALGLARRNLKVPPRRDLPVVASLALFHLALMFVLVFTALQMVPAGRSSVVVWTIPLWTVPLAAIFLKEKMSGRRWTGLLIGLGGVVVLFEPWGLAWSEPGARLGHILLILAAITEAGTTVHVRAHRWTITPLEAMPWQLAGAAIVLTTLGLVIDGLPRIEMTVQLAGVMAYQSILASGVAFLALVVVLRNLTAVSTNLTMMAVPVVGVLSSAFFLGEEISTSLATGLVLVVSGVAINLLSDRTQPESMIEAV